MIEQLLYKDIYRHFTIESHHAESVVVQDDKITVAFNQEMIIGDYLGMYVDYRLMLCEVTTVDGNVITVDGDVRNGTYNAYMLMITPTKLFKSLCAEIEAYRQKNPLDGLQSETIPNYSYTKSEDGLKGWQGVFENELKKYVPNFPKPICEWLCKLDSKL